MLCAISGEAPEVPVASRKSGNVFEKRLIEAYISENGVDPVTSEELNTDDLIDLKTSRTVRPRPPTLTSIPSLLSVFQNEWDALALETYTLRKELAQSRQELSTALYQNDAAVRVVARLSRERDEARDALSKITANGTSTIHGDAMQVDGQGLSEGLVSKITATQERLSKTRRKRGVPDDWATSETLQNLKTTYQSEPLYPGSRSMALNAIGESVLLGGSQGLAGVYSIADKQIVQTLKIRSGAITDTLWAGNRAIIATSSGAVQVFENQSEIFHFSSHAGGITALALHPSGDILASVGVDQSYVLYDLVSFSPATQIFTNSALTTAKFHPDGHLFAAGGVDGQIKVFDVKSGENAANFDLSGPIQCLAFSENGTWLAAVVRGETSVSIWDLRKSIQIKTLEIGSEVKSVRWDYTGQFLVAAGPSVLAVQQYSKVTKDWSEPMRTSTGSIAVEWGPSAQSIISMGSDGSLTEVA